MAGAESLGGLKQKGPAGFASVSLQLLPWSFFSTQLNPRPGQHPPPVQENPPAGHLDSSGISCRQEIHKS